MESDEIPLPPIQWTTETQKTRKECNAEDQQKAEELCVLLRHKCIDRIKTIDKWEPNRDKELITIPVLLPNNFDTSVAYAKLRKDFRERRWVVRRVNYISLSGNASGFEIYPVM